MVRLLSTIICTIKGFLVTLCLMLCATTYAIGENVQDASDTIRVDKLVKRNGRWGHFRILMDAPANSLQFDATCCWILGLEAQTMKDFVNSQLKAYEEVEPYDAEKFVKLNSKGIGADLLLYTIKPRGDALGNLQVYSIEHTNRINGEGTYFMLSIVYDKVKDKILTVDDVFVPEMAAKIKADFGEDFINIHISDFGIWCALASGGEGFDFKDHAYSYRTYEKYLTNDFKQSIGFSELSIYFSQKEEDVYDHNKVHLKPKLGMENKDIKEFFDKNFHWPDELKRKQYKDAFTVKFIVERDGSISNVKTIIPDSTLVVSPIEQEMERVMKLLPPCTPGIFYDIPVRTSTLIYFSFNRKSPSGIEYGIETLLKETWRKADRELQIFRQQQYHNLQTTRFH